MSKKNIPFLAFYPKDFLADTMHLTAEETGAYIRLLSQCWINGYVVNDDKTLSRITMTGRRWGNIKARVKAFFYVDKCITPSFFFGYLTPSEFEADYHRYSQKNLLKNAQKVSK